MSEAVKTPLPPSLDALRSEGAQRFDPARFHYMEVLSRRLSTAPTDVQPILQDKLNHALADYVERWRLALATPGDALPVRPAMRPDVSAGLRLGLPPAEGACALLAELNRYIRQASEQAAPKDTDNSPWASPSSMPEPGEFAEMKSLRRFRAGWAKIAVQDQLDKAIGRGPENAGPLNAHLLALRALMAMRDLSPDYLQRFLTQLDALLWLDQANQQHAVGDAKAGRRSRKEK